MRYVELTESVATDRAVRNHARRVMRDIIARASDELRPGAVLFETTTRGPTPLPVVYTTTSVANLAVGICCTDFPFIVDLRHRPSTLPDGIDFLIAFPGGRISDVVRYFDGHFPASLDQAKSAAWHVLTRYGHFLAAALQDHPDAFIHEFVHYTDLMRAASRNKVPQHSMASKDMKLYVNNPLERNAYYNEVFATLDKKGRVWFQRPFEDVLKDMMGMLDKDFVAHLTNRNRQRLVSRFYREWQTRQTTTLGEAQQHLPQWFQDGRIIGRAGHARQNFLALDKLNVSEFIEDVEFAYEWRFCRVPVASLPKLTKAQIAVLRKMDRNWPERMASVRKLIVKGGIEATRELPIVVLLELEWRITSIRWLASSDSGSRSWITGNLCHSWFG